MLTINQESKLISPPPPPRQHSTEAEEAEQGAGHFQRKSKNAAIAAKSTASNSPRILCFFSESASCRSRTFVRRECL